MGDDLAQHGQIRRDVVVLLRPAHIQAETGDHLVEDHEGPVLVAELADGRVPVRVHRMGAGLAADGLHQDAGDAALVLMLLERSFQGDRNRWAARRRCGRSTRPGMPLESRAPVSGM